MTKILRREDVDVVILNEAPIVLKFQVIKDGKLFYAVDEIARIRFEVETAKAYIDFKPMLREHDLYLFQNIKQRRYGDRFRPYQGAPG